MIVLLFETFLFIPLTLLLFVYLIFIKHRSKLYVKYLELVNIKTDWRYSFLESMAFSIRKYFLSSFICISRVRNNAAKIISYSVPDNLIVLTNFLNKNEYYLPYNPLKKNYNFLKNNHNLFTDRKINKKYHLYYSLVIPTYATEENSIDAVITVYFNNIFYYLWAVFVISILHKHLSFFYGGILRNLFTTYENSAELLLSEIDDYVVLSLDTEARIVSWNKGAEKLFGYRNSEVVKRRFDFLFDKNEDRTLDKALEILDMKNDVRFFAVIRDSMDIPIKVEIRIRKIEHISGGIVGYSVFVDDITKEEIFKENIQQHSFINYTILENSQDGILILDEHDKIVFYNQRVKIILDNPMNLFGVLGKKIFSRRFGEEFEKAISTLRTKGIEFIDIDYSFDKKYYNIRFFRVHKNTSNEYGGVIVFFIDESVRMLTYIELEEKKEDLENINRNLIEAISSARIMQENLIPTELPKTSQFSCEAVYQLSDEIGGDFYFVDVFDIDGVPHALSLISDVSGHGISSSMMNVMVKDIYISFCHGLVSGIYNDPLQFLKILNQKILDLNFSESKFITCFCALANLQTRKIKMCSAGHPLPYYISNSQVSLLQFRRAVPLGVIDEILCDTEELEYQSGDRFIFYTDGFLDLFENSSQKLSDSVMQFLEENIMLSNQDLSEVLKRKDIKYKKQNCSCADDLTILLTEFK